MRVIFLTADTFSKTRYTSEDNSAVYIGVANQITLKPEARAMNAEASQPLEDEKDATMSINGKRPDNKTSR